MNSTEISLNNGELITSNARFWLADIDAAFAEARATGKYVMLAFGPDGCRAWKPAMAVAFMEDDLLGLSTKFIAVMINEKRPGGIRIASIYGVESGPAVLVCNGDGNVLYRIDGTDVSEIIPAVSAVLRNIVVRERCSRRLPVEWIPLRPSFGLAVGRSVSAARMAIATAVCAILG